MNDVTSSYRVPICLNAALIASACGSAAAFVAVSQCETNRCAVHAACFIYEIGTVHLTSILLYSMSTTLVALCHERGFGVGG